MNIFQSFLHRPGRYESSSKDEDFVPYFSSHLGYDYLRRHSYKLRYFVLTRERCFWIDLLEINIQIRDHLTSHIFILRGYLDSEAVVPLHTTSLVEIDLSAKAIETHMSHRNTDSREPACSYTPSISSSYLGASSNHGTLISFHQSESCVWWSSPQVACKPCCVVSFPAVAWASDYKMQSRRLELFFELLEDPVMYLNGFDSLLERCTRQG